MRAFEVEDMVLILFDRSLRRSCRLRSDMPGHCGRMGKACYIHLTVDMFNVAVGHGDGQNSAINQILIPAPPVQPMGGICNCLRCVHHNVIKRRWTAHMFFWSFPCPQPRIRSLIPPSPPPSPSHHPPQPPSPHSSPLHFPPPHSPHSHHYSPHYYPSPSSFPSSASHSPRS